MADTAMLPFTCHDTIGPVALWAATHMLLNAPNGLIMEMVRGYVDGWYNEVLEDQIELVEGHLVLPERPGLGTRLREDVFTRPGARIETSTEESLNPPCLFSQKGWERVSTGLIGNLYSTAAAIASLRVCAV